MIPDKALDLNLPPAEKMTLNDLELFEPGGFSVKGFKAFIARYSNWTAADVGGLEVGELEDAFAKIQEAIQGSAVPKVSASASPSGPAA